MLNRVNDSELLPPGRDAGHRGRLPPRADRDALRSATRPLEVIELLADRGRPLSVTEIALALGIPQSSSSVLLKAMSGAGFIARDRETRKYLPGIRSVLLGNRIGGAEPQRGGLGIALDELSIGAGADVRLAVRSGVHVQYVHVSRFGDSTGGSRIRPGLLLPVGRDALGRMLLLAESESDVRGIIRHGNAVGEPSARLNPESVIEALREHRRQGFACCSDLCAEGRVVLAIPLPSRFGGPAAIGFGLPAEDLATAQARLLGLLRRFAGQTWGREPASPFAMSPPGPMDHFKGGICDEASAAD